MTTTPTATSTAIPTSANGGFVPAPISKIEETGLSLLWLQDLALKIIYYQGYITGFRGDGAGNFGGVSFRFLGVSVEQYDFVAVRPQPELVGPRGGGHEDEGEKG